MIIKNGRLYYRSAIKKDSTKHGSFIFKNGKLYYNLPFKKIPIIVTAYGQKILSITASNISKFIGVARAQIDKVIGAE